MQYQSEMPREWQHALMGSLTPEQIIQMRLACHRASRRAEEAAKNRLVPSGASKSDESRNNNFAQQNRIQTTVANEVLAQSASSAELPKSVPVPPRPFVTRTQVQSTSTQPLQTSTSNHTTANTSAASATAVQASTPTTQPSPLVPSTQPVAPTISRQQPLTGTIAYGSQYNRYGVPPPLSVPTADGKYVGYVYVPHLNQYVREDMVGRPVVPSNSFAPNIQQPPTVAPQDVSALTQVKATISIPPATPPQKPSGTTTDARTPQQADKSRLARDILRSLGMDELPAVVAEEDEEAGILNNLSATTERQQDSSHEASHEAPRGTDLILSPPLMAQSSAQPAQSPLEPVTIDLTMDDETNTIAPGDGATLPISPPITTSIPAPTSMNRDDLKHEADETLPPKSPPPTVTSGAASIFSHQDELASRVDGMSIATGMQSSKPNREDEHMEPNREVEHMDTISFTDLDEPLPSFHKPAGSSSPAPSFRVQSHEQIEDVANGVLPLFLPSPIASPAPSGHSFAPLPPETDDEVIIVETILRGVSSPKRRGDLDVLSLDDERSLTPPQNVRRKKGQRVYVLVPPPPPDLKRAIKKRKLEKSGMVSGSEEEECTSMFPYM